MSPWLHNTIPCLFCIQPKGLPKLIAFPSFAALASKSYWRRHLAFANFWREAWPKWSQHMLSISWGHPPPSVLCGAGHYHLAAAWLPLWTVVPNPVNLALWATRQSQQLLSYESDQAICVPPPLEEETPMGTERSEEQKYARPLVLQWQLHVLHWVSSLFPQWSAGTLETC